MKYTIYVLVLYFLSCSSDTKDTVFINSNTGHQAATTQLLDSAINRRSISIPSFNTSNIRFQYLSTDEWGMYFTLLRFSNNGNITLIEEDTFTRLHSTFSYNLSTNERKNIERLLTPILDHELEFPDPSRNLIDGGDNSVIFAKGDTTHVKYWQYNDRLPQHDGRQIDLILDSLKQIVQKKKQWYQE